VTSDWSEHVWLGARPGRRFVSRGVSSKRAWLLAVLWFALFPGSALGATAHVEGTVVDRRTLIYVASPGEANQVEIALDVDADTVTIHDSGAAITAGAGCVGVNANEVTCHPVDYQVSISLADGADALELTQGGLEVYVDGGTGNDEMTACDDCFAYFWGDGGNDVLAGDHALLAGGSGDDVLTSVFVGPIGGGGDDRLASNSFNLWGGGGDDEITGGDGSNHIVAGSGNDTVVAGEGRDFVSPGLGSNTVDGGPGRDLVSYWDVRKPVVVDLEAGRASHLGDDDRLMNVEDARGSPLGDRLMGDSQDNELVGGGGADELRGGDGSDRLWGNGRDDLLVGGLGSDRLHGDEGDDRLKARDRTRDVVAGGTGHDAARVDRVLDRIRSVEEFF
jgi:Ca2+-binding RTX toxin-like protein